jgi:hypothetical protein
LGAGIIWLSDGVNRLLTANHVAELGKSFDIHADGINEYNVSSEIFGSRNCLSEPVVAVPVTSFSGKGAEFHLLEKGDYPLIKELIAILISKSKHRYLSNIREYSYDKYKNVMSACVNYKEGDSGGPVFAVLEGGVLRYCGVCSRGDETMLEGNKICFLRQDTYGKRVNLHKKCAGKVDVYDRFNVAFNNDRKKTLVSHDNRSQTHLQLDMQRAVNDLMKKIAVIVVDPAAEGDEIQYYENEGAFRHNPEYFERKEYPDDESGRNMRKHDVNRANCVAGTLNGKLKENFNLLEGYLKILFPDDPEDALKMLKRNLGFRFLDDRPARVGGTQFAIVYGDEGDELWGLDKKDK